MRHLLKLLFLFAIIAVGHRAFSQTDTEKALKAEKIAFLTKKLELTADEAKVFWPIYDEYWEKKNKILSDRYKLANDFIQNINNISDREIVDYTNRYVDSQKREADLIAEYNKRLLQVLPPKKVMLLYQSNYEFKNYLLQKVQESKK